MSDIWRSVTHRWQDSVNVLLGIWLIVSPWILQFTGIELAFWNAVILGVIIAVAAIAALARFHRWGDWADVVFGVWLVVSPWVLGFAALSAAPAEAGAAQAGAVPATWNFIIVGLLTLALAGWSLEEERHRETRMT